jgi:hypothetical protein
LARLSGYPPSKNIFAGLAEKVSEGRYKEFANIPISMVGT